MERANLDQMQVVETSTNELIDEANAAMDTMANSNPNKRLIFRLASALVALSDRYALETNRIKEN